jgi:putative solute:sodium symporter small subunit
MQDPSTNDRSRLEAYWAENRRLIFILTAIWFLVTFGHPIIAKALNNFTILTGFPVGYWMASQFALTVYVILIFVYAFRMNRVIDPKYGFVEDEE